LDSRMLADAGALLALSSTANAGITIPAGDWTLDVGGVVNAYYTSTRYSGDAAAGTGALGLGTGAQDSTSNITTGLLPNYLSVSGKSRQNDLDIGFTISINPGASTDGAGRQSSQQENRQAFLTIGDASWGSVKLGKDLGIFASDAILNDMTLLGVGSGGGMNSNINSTNGGIGTGYIYAAWKAQAAYTTPNFNGFQATAGITQAWNTVGSERITDTLISANTTGTGGASNAYEGKASYSFAANDVTGKVWVSGFAQKVNGVRNGETAWSADVGANLKLAGFDLTGYYYTGEGTGATFMLYNGYSTTGYARDVDGGYVQAKYTLPTKTVVGISWGKSNLDAARGETATTLVKENIMTTAGLYHPLTKHLNLVAEWNDIETKAQAGAKNQVTTGSLGAILFF